MCVGLFVRVRVSVYVPVVMGLRLAKLDVHVVMLGLDAAGKTTVLYRLKYDQFMGSNPTVGFNCEKVKGTLGEAKGISFMIWDVGGQDKVRSLWRSYTRATDGIVFVVDSKDIDRLEEAKVELHRIAGTPEAASVPILVLANKQDLPKALPADAVEGALRVPDIRRGRQVAVRQVCAITGDGLDEALDNLYQMIKQRRKEGRSKSRKTRT